MPDRSDAAREVAFDLASPRVVFGAGALRHLPREADRLGCRRLLVVCTPGRGARLGERAAGLLGDASAGVFAGAVMHVPADAVEAALAEAARSGADGIVSVGGGSTTGLGKAIALSTGLPLVAVPTTYAGSEMTPMYGLTEGCAKRTGIDVRVRPRTVVYDPELSVGLPVATTVTSALNGIAHAAEGLYAPDGNPLVDGLAEAGIRLLAGAIARLHAEPGDLAARADALSGAWLCGQVMGSITVGLHHKLCHLLGGTFGLPHAEVHAVVLPHAVAANAAFAPAAMQRLARSLDAPSDDAATALHGLARDHGAPTSLRELGLHERDLDRAAELAVQKPYPNPRPLERAWIRALLQRAFDGSAPHG